jgi:D-glycero-alpha-D-manno-heptose-7-phosphate kinase
MDMVVSAPCRLSVGGMWDLKAFAIPCEYLNPTSINFALNMRTRVMVLPFTDRMVRVGSGDIVETYPFDELPFDTTFGLVFAIVHYFNIHGIEIRIYHDAPVKSGLGGSGILSVCLIKALGSCLSQSRIVSVAHNIEDGMRISITGMQDQCAAVYGGVNKWTWNYNSENKNAHKKILPQEHYPELESRLLLAYMGESRNSSNINKDFINSFNNGRDRKTWIKTIGIVNELAGAMNELSWDRVIELIQEENDICLNLVPSRLIGIGRNLRDTTKEMGAGFSIAGAGGGGCVWALCRDADQKKELEKKWIELLRNIPNAKILDVRIEDRGLIVDEGISVIGGTWD